MQALSLHAGPRALDHLRRHGLQPAHVRAIAAAAGGPKGLILNGLDRHLFGHWLTGPGPTLHLSGASIGAWRMAAACLPDAGSDAAMAEMAERYIACRYDPPPGQRLRPGHVSASYGGLLRDQLGGHEAQLLSHPRRRLHVVTSRGRHVLRRERRFWTGLGYGAAFLSNLAHRRGLGLWLERVLFSDPRESLPVPLDDLPTRRVALDAHNLLDSVRASGAIPFWLDAVHDLPGAPRGAYWDGGITDYHLHWPWARWQGAPADVDAPQPIVLVPHVQSTLVPGWLDKALRARHRPTPALDNVLLLCPRRDWIATLPNAKLPDRNDFKHLPVDQRQRDWRVAVQRSRQLADEFDGWLARGAPVDAVRPLGVPA
ncbi:patatin-like phospholipase domain-containing protein [Leptothrix discophora]|uniref:Phospholipase n=1 Tax=Leptothrix discophora TaxID=89 RepID=A0ABT9G043_LEPDI|nr:phospholipase [Leptothrix discophora]MDP4299568.1 phospholipase [Leptothrix discophora]